MNLRWQNQLKIYVHDQYVNGLTTDPNERSMSNKINLRFLLEIIIWLAWLLIETKVLWVTRVIADLYKRLQCE